MGNGIWLITILKEQPWIGLAFGLALFLALFLLKKWLVMKMAADKEKV
ncbi:MAG: hypothetical protein ABFS39_17970 [Pseudomonadota bacterium]